MESFLSAYGSQRLADVIGDKSPASEDLLAGWLDPPPAWFAKYLEDRPHQVSPAALLLDHSALVPEIHRREPTYTLTQMHRLWITVQAVERHCPPGGFVVDLGAFPFGLEIVLRECRDFRGRIVGTVNRPLDPGYREELASRAIESAALDLDPLVRDAGFDNPSTLDLPDGASDLVVLAHVIEHLYHPMIALREAARLLRPGGRLIVSSDNAQRLDTLLRMLWRNEFLYDPVEQTAAMAFHFWRGHNRVFTAHDLQTMVSQVGLTPVETTYHEVFYHTFSHEYFRQGAPNVPSWRAKLLGELPGYRNELIVIAEKPRAAPLL